VLYGCLAGAALAIAVEAHYVLLGKNLHTVIPNRVYRCAQQSADSLEQIVRQHGILTVVNLRGCCAPFPWYVEESRATQHLDIEQEDICLSSGRLPPVDEIRQLVGVLEHAAYPILLHCRRGADRTGLVSAVVVLRWHCDIEPLEVPRAAKKGETAAIRVRVRNTGSEVWQLRPENNAGIHVGYILLDDLNQWVATGRSGLFEKQVAPGQSIDLTLVFAPWKQPGRYRLLVDMVDERHGWFFQTGSEPFEKELEIRE
jgi:protein tyrosine phosphatase (PTP) superfamily phosphohydrolase (DUF442 family)